MHATRSPELLAVPAVAERLNVNKATVYRWITEGRIPAVRLGPPRRPLRIPADELDEWLYSNPTGLDASSTRRVVSELERSQRQEGEA